MAFDEIIRELRDTFGLDEGQRMKVQDPLLGDSAEVVIDPGEPGGSKETTRLTLHVPHDDTVLSLGRPAVDWQADEGITGYTDNHIRLEVTKDVKTFVSLGKPSAYGLLSGKQGLSPQASSGYSLVTEGAAWSESKESFVAVSQEKDAVLATNGYRAVVMSTSHHTNIGGQSGVAMASPSSVMIAAHTGVKMPDLSYQSPVGSKLSSTSEAAVTEGGAHYATMLDTAVNAVSTVLPALETSGTSLGSPDWAPGGRDILGVVMGAYNTAAGLGWVNSFGSGANVDVTAEQAVGITAGRSAGMYGHLAAGVGSLGFSSMFGMTAGVTGMLGLGLVGVKAAELASSVDASVRSFKDATISGQSSVKVESPKGWVGVSSRRHTQVTSSGNTSVFASDTASVIAGYGEGHGLIANAQMVFLGHATSTTKLQGGAKPDGDKGVKVSKDQLWLNMDQARLGLTGNGGVVVAGKKAVEMKVGSNGIHVKKSKLLLG